MTVQQGHLHYFIFRSLRHPIQIAKVHKVAVGLTMVEIPRTFDLETAQANLTESHPNSFDNPLFDMSWWGCLDSWNILQQRKSKFCKSNWVIVCHFFPLSKKVESSQFKLTWCLVTQVGTNSGDWTTLTFAKCIFWCEDILVLFLSGGHWALLT